jgi:hypothetical protein
MEKLLITWIKERQMKGDPVTQAMICEKARLIFEELQKKTPGSTSNKTEEFKASRGWFHRFKGRTERERQSTLDQFVIPVQAKRRREEVEQDKEDPLPKSKAQ